MMRCLKSLYKLGSIFTGYGGLDMAVDFVVDGVEVVWVADTKPASKYLLEYYYPDLVNLGDVKQVDWSEVEPVDILAASWPCQPHSAAGRRLGESDPRALWPEVIRAVKELRPAYFFGENVSRICTNGELARVIRSFDEIGYVGGWTTITAGSVGAPHKRDRTFVVASDATNRGQAG